jgi:glucose/arabinose dehydrogenase
MKAMPLQPTYRLLLATALLLPGSLNAGVASQKVADGFDRPVWAGVPSGTSGKLWVMEQAGRVWIVDESTGNRLETPFLDLRDAVSRKNNEEGLLGLAFAPDFQETGRFYVNFTDKDNHTQIVRLVSKDRLTTDPATAEVLMRFRQDFSNHNGGWIGFGPDGMLYIANGDGGAANDPKERAQDLSSLLGKMLRIDVSPSTGYKVPADNPFLKSTNAKPEIWASGLRNPWRCSFDRETGDFWIADVGQDLWEEINFLPNNKGAGANFGWRLREGEIETPKPGVGGRKPKGNVEPVYVYAHGNGPDQGISVTGGYVYRGPVKSLQGRYVFADYQNPRIWSFRLDRGKPRDFQDHTDDLQPEGGRINLISSFAENNQGDLFLIDHSGPIYRFIEAK